MASSNRQSSQKRPSDSRRAESVPLTFSSDLDRRQETRAEDDDFVDDHEFPSDPLRSPTSSIRFQPPVPNQSQKAAGQRRGEARDMRTDRDTTGVNPTPVPLRAGRSTQTGTAPVPGVGVRPPQPSSASHPQRRSMHWMVYVGVGMIAALALWVSLSAILAWGTTQYNNIVYGYPRFYQTDAVVGHGDSPSHPSHFIAQNLHGQVIVIELPAGNPSKSYEYIGPDLIATGDDQIPITLSFSDVNHNGKPEMIIHIEEREVIFCNDGAKFTQCSS